MNLYEIIGAACLDEEFREALFNGWAEALGDYGFGPVTSAEERGLQKLTSGEKAAEAKAGLGRLGLLICPRPPACPFRLSPKYVRAIRKARKL